MAFSALSLPVVPRAAVAQVGHAKAAHDGSGAAEVCRGVHLLGGVRGGVRQHRHLGGPRLSLQFHCAGRRLGSEAPREPPAPHRRPRRQRQWVPLRGRSCRLVCSGVSLVSSSSKRMGVTGYRTIVGRTLGRHFGDALGGALDEHNRGAHLGQALKAHTHTHAAHSGHRLGAHTNTDTWPLLARALQDPTSELPVTKSPVWCIFVEL